MGEDKKLQAALKKLNVQPVSGIEEVNMFREDGNVLHFKQPKGELAGRGSRGVSCVYAHMLTLAVQSHNFPPLVHGVGASNTYAVYGAGADKELTDLVPGILSQLGPDSLASLRKLAESYQAMNAANMGAQGGAGGDDEVPDVVSGRESSKGKRYLFWSDAHPTPSFATTSLSLPPHSQPISTRPTRRRTVRRQTSRSSTKPTAEE